MCGLLLGLGVLAMAAPAVADGPRTPGSGYRPAPPKDGFSYPECYCTDSDGRRVEIGERRCLRIGRREMTAECGMSLNSPAWRRISEGCPVS
jgi:hypothetical protein